MLDYIDALADDRGFERVQKTGISLGGNILRARFDLVRAASSVISSRMLSFASIKSSQRNAATSPTRNPHKCVNRSIVLSRSG